MSKPLPALSSVLFFPFRNSNQVSDRPFSEISSFPVFAFCDLYKYHKHQHEVLYGKKTEAYCIEFERNEFVVAEEGVGAKAYGFNQLKEFKNFGMKINTKKIKIMNKKVMRIICTISLSILFGNLYGQWAGAGDQTSGIYRSGYVGIGATSTPLSLLHLNSTVDARQTFRIYWNSDLSKYLSIFQGTGGAAIDPIGTGKLYLGYDQSTEVIFNGSINAGTNQLQFLSASGGNNRIQSFGGSEIFGSWLFKSRFDHMIFDAGESAGNERRIIFKTGGADRMLLDYYGNVGIGATSPFASTNNKGLHISQGDHTSILLGNPISNSHGGILQTSDNRHRIFIGANMYDDQSASWQNFQQGKGGAGISLVADEGSWGTSIQLFASKNSGDLVIPRMHINGDGQVGIGATSLNGKLHVAGTLYSGATRTNTVFSGAIGIDNANFVGSEGYWALRTATDNSFNLDVYNASNAMAAITVLQNGNTGIGTTTPGSFKLAVNGKIWTQEVNVAMTNPGPDYVFEQDYDLISLTELETYITQHKHLPEVPSAKEMEANGLNLKEMNLLLLKKVEEMTLHMIEMKKQLDVQQKLIQDLIKK